MMLAEHPNRQNQSWRHSRSVSDFNHYHSFEFLDSQWLKASQILSVQEGLILPQTPEKYCTQPLSVQNAPHYFSWRYQLLKNHLQIQPEHKPVSPELQTWCQPWSIFPDQSHAD